MTFVSAIQVKTTKHYENNGISTLDIYNHSNEKERVYVLLF